MVHKDTVSEPQLSDLDDIETSSVGSAGAYNRRVSMLYTTPRKGTGVEMDHCTVVANEMLQRGKEALEAAVTMKRESRATVYECLQGLYETVLSLSDSRNRHKYSLEKERARHAKELISVERAHNKELHSVKQALLSGLETAQTNIMETLKETQAVRSWLGYETIEPFRRIKELRELQSDLEAKLNELIKGLSSSGSNRVTTETDKIITETIKSVGQRIGSLSTRIEQMSGGIEETKSYLIERIESIPRTQGDEAKALDTAGLERKLESLTQQLTQYITLQQQQQTQHTKKDLTPELETISERIEIMTSELRTWREANKTVASPIKQSLHTEIAVQEVKQTLDSIKEGVTKLTPKNGPHTFAQVAAIPKPDNIHQPNHTLIISSRNPKETSDNVLTKMKATLDLKQSGARMERIRKARDQKVVVKCATKEDMVKIKGQIQTNTELTVREPLNQDPLVCVRGVLSCYSNEEILDHIKAQNGHILEGVDKSALKMKVKYRKRARNPHECHPVLELSPEVWKKFTQIGKIYVGFGRCSVEDQSPLVQCMRCLGYGHTKALCKEKDACNHCGGEHTGRDCPSKARNEPPKCVNCTRAKRTGSDLAHTAYSAECQERLRWDKLARSRVQYC